MSGTPSWFKSNSLSGFNHFLKNVTQPFDWVDKKVNLVRRIPIVNNFVEGSRNHLGDTAAVAALATGAYFGGSAALAAGEGSTAGSVGGAGVAGGAATLPADVSVGTTGAGGTTGVADGASAGAGGGWQSYARMGGQLMQGQQQPQQQPSVNQLGIIQNPTYQERAAALAVPDVNYAAMQPSSRRLKTPVQASFADIARAGATGEDQVSENGVHIGAIRALNDQISELESAARAKGYQV